MTAPVMATGTFGRRLWPGLNHQFGINYERRTNEFQDIFEIRKSDKRFELGLALKGMGLASVKQESDAFDYDSFSQYFTSMYVNVVYAKGFQISHEMLEDDQYSDNLIAMGTRELDQKMAITKEIIGQNVLNNAFSSSYVGGDGVSLGNSAHPLANGGTFSNVPSTNADLSEAALEQSWIDIRTGFVDETGILVKLSPKYVVIHPSNKFTADRIFLNQDRPATANRDINAIVRSRAIDGYRIASYLTSTVAWYVIVDCPDSLIHFTREGYEMRADDDFDTMNTKVKCMERYCFGWSNPRGIYAVQGV